MKVLVLGVTGMLGHAVFKLFSADDRYDTWGTLRGASGLGYFSDHLKSRLLPGIDVLDQDVLADVLAKVRPDVVINCVGLIKQLSSANDPLSALPINAMLPHRLAKLCALLGARLVHISTDCVFSGSKGSYTERDVSDANDLYGRSKFIGELHDLPHAITLRTSIIGHELGSCYALVDWFLSQSESVKGYAKAIFQACRRLSWRASLRTMFYPIRACMVFTMFLLSLLISFRCCAWWQIFMGKNKNSRGS